ncbi:8-oxo-dGTP diphosphatase [Paenibacillus sp. J2TS4]|uniref:NUDIX hydrolase n=1 Tax=Paenibacillus sp. J2TS4 TaxID=2807194 RepID=UPI001B2F4351|nr:8-oxo-dGTP diphosphatase [Paenibacillus sp. J2TS4]GIP36544.1 7,8-dihydro-8-oxoguanine triphosphatase [Paenibacillus sp. J2TS4]
MLKYTICYIRWKDSLLLLNRKSPPVMGLWHGVGGKLEPGETPVNSVLREVAEETGLLLNSVKDKGKITWEVEGASFGGMYAFLTELPDPERYATPRLTEEGILDWKPVEWVLDPRNEGIPSHARHYLPLLLNDPSAYDHQFVFVDGRLVSYSSVKLTSGIVAESPVKLI